MFAFHLMLDYRFITYFTINTCYLLTISHTWWRPNTLNWWCHEIFALSHIGSNRVYLRNEGGNYCGCNSYLICISIHDSIPYQPGHTPVPLLIELTIVSDGAPPITKINASTLLINWLSQLIHTPFSNWKWMQEGPNSSSLPQMSTQNEGMIQAFIIIEKSFRVAEKYTLSIVCLAGGCRVVTQLQ